jgi:hypothetical protein
MATEDRQVWFGIGCVYFTAGAEGNKTWKDMVIESLAKIPSVSDVEVDLQFPEDELEASPGSYPMGGMLRFHLHVSLSEQKGLDKFLERIPMTTEDFTVLMYFQYYGPVTFVLPQLAESSNDASSSIIAVREYLKRELSQRQLPVKLTTIGPSPFHADACIESADIAEKFRLERIPSRAFDKLIFSYSERDFESSEYALITLLDDISDELSFYYSLVRRRLDRMHDSDRIAEMARELLDIYEATGFKAKMQRIFVSSAKIRRVALRAVAAQYEAQDDELSSRRSMDELYSSDLEPYFTDYIEEEIGTDYANDILGAKEVVSLLDQARERQIQVTSLFLSAIAGGLAGALVSVLIH